MSTRETTEVKTESGHVLTLYTYITGREKRQINEVYLRDMQMSQKGDVQELTGVKGTSAYEAENKTFELIVVKIVDKNGEEITGKKQVVDFILDLPSDEYEEVVAAVNEITNPKASEATS